MSMLRLKSATGIRNLGVMTLVASIAVIVLSGCSGKEETATPVPSASASVSGYTGGPVELVIGDLGAQVTADDVIKLLQPLVQAKYPQITLKQAALGSTADSLQKAMLLGVPDIIITAATYFSLLQAVDFPEELEPMVKRFNIDMNRMDPVIVGDLRKIAGRNKTALYGLPFDQQLGGMLYNKDLFNKFGVAYPREKMNWDEVIELTRRMTRTDNGVSYYGLVTTGTINLLKEAGVSNYNSKDESISVLTSEGHKRVLGMIQSVYGQSGYKNGIKTSYGDVGFNTYGKDGVVAMFANAISKTVMTTAMNFDWDVTSYPIFKETPNIGKNVDFRVSTVSKTSKNKEAAYHVLSILVSDVAQLAMNKDGRYTILKDEKIKAAYAETIGFFKGKNLAAVYKLSPAPVPDYSPYASLVNAELTNATNAIVLKGTDINTALREAEETANKNIKAAIGK